MIEVLELSKQFPGVLAVDGVSFTCKSGEIFGLLGPNGAGKTTTLRMLSTVITPTGGTARVAGYDIIESPGDVRNHIGVLSENTGLYDRFNPFENVDYFAALYGMEKGESRQSADALFDALELEERKRPVGGFSKGMRQKVAIARALVHDPEVLIFDEPIAGLDVMSQRAVHGFLRSQVKEKKTVLLSTHNMDEAELLCDRIAIISRGRIGAMGTLDQLRKQTGESDLENVFVKIVGMDAIQERVAEKKAKRPLFGRLRGSEKA